MAGSHPPGPTQIPPRQTIEVDKPSLYLHIPFCQSRCGYCTFASGTYDEATADAYLDAVRRELTAHGLDTGFRPSTIFLGGGTPSVLTPRQLRTLFSFLPLPASPEAEVTCEVNPDSATPENLDLLRAAGVTRISFGVQTFSDPGLRLLGRRHDAATARAAVVMARSAGFARLSLDLINGWPTQTEAILEDDLRQALDLGVDHISCYNFMLEPSARDHARLAAMTQPDEEWDRRCWDVTESYLCGRSGYTHYEISNFARPGAECRHNVAIWKGGPYAGLGAAACGYLGGRRYGNTPDTAAYIQWHTGSLPEAWSECLQGEAAARECAVFWLRLYEGIDVAAFHRRTGYDFATLYHSCLERFVSEGIMEWKDEKQRICVAPHWMPVLDSVLEDLV